MTDNNARVTTFSYSEPPSVEPGWYPATLYCVEIIQHKTYGERWRWVFTIRGVGEGGKDMTVSRWTSPFLSKKSTANNIVEALIGRRVTKDNPDLDFADLEGKPCMLDVVRDDEGYNQVKTVAQPQAATPAVAAALDPEYAAFLAAKAKAAQSDPQQLPPPPAAPPVGDVVTEF